VRTYILLLLALGLLTSLPSWAQSQVDSLKGVIKSGESKAAVSDAYLSWGEAIYLKSPDSALLLFTKAKEVAEDGLNAESPLDSTEVHTLETHLAAALNNMGFICANLGQIEMALKYNSVCLSLQEKLRDTLGIAMSLNNIATIYNGQKNFEKTIEYTKKSLAMREAINDDFGIAMSLNNLGLVYQMRGDFEKGLEYNLKSLKIRERINDKVGLASSLNNIAGIYLSTGLPEKSLEYYKRSLAIRREIGDQGGLANSLNNICKFYRKHKQPDSAISYATQSLEIAQQIKYPDQIKSASRSLYQLYKINSQWQESLDMYEIYISMRDSLNNEGTLKATIRQQTKYEFEKAQIIKEQEEKERRAASAEAERRRNNLQYSVILITILVLFGGMLSIGFVKVSTRMAEGIIFFSFLILFEFLLVLADPYIDNWSGGAPGIKLLFNAGIAALIFPMHSLFETKLKKRLTK